MPRYARFTRPDKQTVYHVISRTALPGLPINDIEKDHLLTIIRYFARIYFVDVLGFCIMGNHFHLAVRVYPTDHATREEVRKRFALRYGQEVSFGEHDFEKYQEKWTDLSEFVAEIKQTFSRQFNKRHNRRGYFWGERFKSMIVQEGHTLVNLLAYIDLNPIRAAIVKRPEDYKWSSLGYHIQTGNKGDLLSVDFGMKEWNEHKPKEIVRKYREFVYETGAVDAGKGAVIDQKIVDKERKKKYKVRRVDRFMYRTRYFTEAGIIGSKEFVGEVFDQVKHLLRSKDTRKFTPVGGVEGVYSMKRLGQT